MKLTKYMLIVLLVFNVVFYSHSNEKTDTFFVQVFDTKIKVLAPDEYRQNLSLIIENQMVVKLVGKVVTHDNRLIQHVSIRPRKSISVDLKFDKHEKIYFVPLSPAFQEAELKIGKKSYEIPPAR